MAGTRRRSAGIHLDGPVGTLVLLDGTETSPKVTAIRQAQGFTAAEALQRLLPLVEDSTPIRVTFTTDGVAATPVDLTPAMLDRAGFSSAARRAFGPVHSSAALAGVVADAAGVQAGQIATGLAVAAPADVVTSLYRVLAPHTATVEVTACAAAHGALDGLHLALRRTTSELTFVSDGVPRLSALLAGGGSDTLAARLGHDEQQAASVLAGHTHDPAAAHLIRSWLTQVVDEVVRLRTEWAISGYDTPTRVLVHGKSAGAAGLDDLLAAAGLGRDPHPLVALPHPAPLDAVDAYLAAVSAGTRLPLAVFHDPTGAAHTRPGRRPRAKTARNTPQQPSSTRRRAPSPPVRVATRVAAAVTVLAALGAVGHSSWSRFAASQERDTAHGVVAANPDRSRGAAATQLRQIADRVTATRVAARVAADCTRCTVTVVASTTTAAVVDVATTDVTGLLDALDDTGVRVAGHEATADGVRLHVDLRGTP